MASNMMILYNPEDGSNTTVGVPEDGRVILMHDQLWLCDTDATMALCNAMSDGNKCILKWA